MAEVAGAIASAVTLFQLCIQGFDFIRSVKQQEIDLHKLTVRLSIEKCWLYMWGGTMGLTKGRRAGSKRPLEHCRFCGNRQRNFCVSFSESWTALRRQERSMLQKNLGNPRRSSLIRGGSIQPRATQRFLSEL